MAVDSVVDSAIIVPVGPAVLVWATGPVAPVVLAIDLLVADRIASAAATFPGAVAATATLSAAVTADIAVRVPGATAAAARPAWVPEAAADLVVAADAAAVDVAAVDGDDRVEVAAGG
jgi:hypothetical protein